MSVADRIAANAWLLGICRDVRTFLALKGHSRIRRDGSLGRLRLKGLDHTVLFRPETTDIPVLWELFHTREYEFTEGWPFKTVVDCGANVGMFLAWVVRQSRYGTNRYVGVEPDEDAFRVLSKQVLSLGVQKETTLFRAAVWDRVGSVGFNADGPSWSHHVVDGDGPKVRAMTLGAILDEARLDSCDLLKLDIEGGERQVLGALADHAHRIGTLVAELHGGLDYHWFAATVERAGFLAAPPGRLFNLHPGAVRKGSAFERFVRAT